ncbi:MAG: hypothetical protein MI974_24450, partial [Chitinophagales bacterium]|nr:hypothetical protein [Chitinophagales bacterium]
MLKHSLLWLLLVAMAFSCNAPAEQEQEAVKTEPTTTEEGDFQYLAESFADKKIIRYRIAGFDQLSLDQKKLVYYLTEAGLCGRDISYDQNYRHNLEIRAALDKIVADFEGAR